MAHLISAKCEDKTCALCVKVCPSNCILPNTQTGAAYVIDPSLCTDCGACEPVCPVAAIYPDDYFNACCA